MNGELLLGPPDLVVHPRFHERGHETLAPGELALAARQRGYHILVGGVRLGHVLAVAVREVATGHRLKAVHAHRDDGAEEVPNVVVPGGRGDGSVGEVAKDVIKLLPLRLAIEMSNYANLVE